MTELRASWKVGQPVVCNVALLWHFAYESCVVVAFNICRTVSSMITAVVKIATIIACL